jgi:hypothetical protein
MRSGVAVVLVLAWMTAAPTVAAQTIEPEPGVFIDPRSPSSKEYDIPLERARRGADPGTDPDSPVGQGQRGAAPLFGAGITAAGGGDETGDGAGPGGGQRNGDDQGSGTATAGDPPAAVVEAATNPTRPTGDGGTSLAIVGIALAVLLAGSGAGWLLRRRGS